jgi:predicted RNase H-like HicB family nuclease
MTEMSDSLELSIVYEDGGDGWIVAWFPQVPGTHSQGRTREEARAYVIDALNVMLAGDDESLGARSEGPRVVTGHGTDAVVVSVEEYRRLVGDDTRLVEFIRLAPDFDVLELERAGDRPGPRKSSPS